MYRPENRRRPSTGRLLYVMNNGLQWAATQRVIPLQNKHDKRSRETTAAALSKGVLFLLSHNSSCLRSQNSLEVITSVFPKRWLLCHTWQPLSPAGQHTHQLYKEGEVLDWWRALCGFGENLKVLLWGSFRRLTCNKGYLPRTHSLYSWWWHKGVFKEAHSCMKANGEWG